MPTDPPPDGQGILNRPAVKPFPQPAPVQDEGTAPDSFVTPDMEEPADTHRPPLGN